MKTKDLGQKVRIGYSIIINNITKLVSMFFNFVFVLILTHNLTALELSSWVLLSRIFEFLVIFTSIYTLWSTRAVSRGWNVSNLVLRMALETGGIVSVFGFVFLLVFNSIVQVQIMIILAVVLFVFERYISIALLSIVAGYKPEYIGVSQLIMATSKVPFGYLFIIQMRLGLFGAFLSLIIAELSALSFLFLVNKKMLVGSFYDRDIIRRWLKYSWYPLILTTISSMIYFDVIVVRVVSGSNILIAYYAGIFFIINFVRSLNISRSVIYSKILAERKLDHVDDTIWWVSLFLVPMITIIISLSRQVLYIFGEQFVLLDDLLPIFLVGAGINVIYILARDAYLAWERADYDIYAPIRITKTVFKDILFLDAFQIFSYLVSLVFICLISNDLSSLLFWWGVLFGVVNTVSIIILNIEASRRFKIRITRLSTIMLITRFLLAGILVFLVRKAFISVPLHESLLLMILSLSVVGAKLIFVYYGTLFLLDGKFRSILLKMLRKFKEFLV